MGHNLSKPEVLAACQEHISKKIKGLKGELDAVQESAIADTKSSMGDKYETGREVMMQERNRLAAQLEILSDQLASLNAIEPKNKHDEVRQGSLVQTDKATFFLSAAIGQITINDQQVFVISGAAPLGKAMKSKKAKESFSFNSQTYSIKHLE